MYKDKINIENGILQIRRIMRIFRNYINDKAFWSKAFLNYITIRVALLGAISGFFITLVSADFHNKILSFAKVDR